MNTSAAGTLPTMASVLPIESAPDVQGMSSEGRNNVVQVDSIEAAGGAKESESDQTPKGCVSPQSTTPDIVENKPNMGDLQNESGSEHVCEGIGPLKTATPQLVAPDASPHDHSLQGISTLGESEGLLGESSGGGEVKSDMNEGENSGEGELEFDTNEGETSSENAQVATQNAGPLGAYHRGVAVRMLTDYLRDLETLNEPVLHGASTQTIPEHIAMVQKRLGDYRKALKDLDDANNREPNSQLTVTERIIVRRMLRDYQTALEDSLDVDTGNPSMVSPKDFRRSTPGEVMQHIQEVKNFEMTLSSIHLDDMVQSPWSLETINFPVAEVSELQVRFPLMLEMVADGLKGCEARVEELRSTLLNQVNVYKAQCTHLARALAGHVRKNFPVYHATLRTIPLMKSEVIGVGIGMGQRDQFRAVSFCIKSLAELDRTLGLAVELVSMCGKLEWTRTALRMSNAPAHPKIPRPSAFTIALRQCEWALDAVELFFHVFKKLLRSNVDPNWKDGVIFKWNNEDRRMVLQILGQPAPADATTANKDQSIGALKVTQELEVRDRSKLLEEISSLSTRKLRRWFSKPDVQILTAKFLEKKLRGPTPQATYLPFQSFSIDHTELHYQHYIDVGSVGMVAEYKWLGETVAAKSVRAPGESRARFEEEAAILATVQHPNVVRLLGAAFQEEKETGMLVMELMECDLRSLIDKRMRHEQQPFPLIVAVDIMIQIAEAMHYLVAHRVLHRDLKAKNILVSRCKLPPRVQASGSGDFRELFTFPDLDQLIRVEEFYVVKLADFGLAKCRPMTSHCTTVNTGTTLWRAPEVFHLPDAESSTEYKWSADIYSFGMTCYEILSGRIPFEGAPNHSILQRIQRGERPNLEGKAPPALVQLIKRCWETRPENRPNIDEIIKQLWCCKVEIVFGSIQSLHIGGANVNRT